MVPLAGLIRPLLLAIIYHGSTAICGEYQGVLDGSPLLAELIFDGTTVTGSYYFQATPQNRKTLKGSNPREGLIQLDEFVGETMVARMTLTKAIVGSEVVWSGVRGNQDGQSVIQFSRTTALDRPSPPVVSGTTPLSPGTAAAPSPFIPGEPIPSERASAYFGTPGRIEAHRFGRLYLGWEAHTSIPPGDDLESIVKKLRAEGQPLWAALRFVGSDVELQFESTAGIRFTLSGTNPREGVITLTDENGVGWDFEKQTTDQALIWEGRSRANPSHVLFIYRPRHIIPPGDPVFPDEMNFVEPEAFLYSNHVATEASGFVQSRFPYLLEESLEGVVAEVIEGPEGVEKLVVNLNDGRQIHHIFSPARPRNRVPVAVGYPISMDQAAASGEIAFARISLFPLAWRKSGEHRFELSMVPTPFDDFQWDDQGNFRVPSDSLMRFPRVSVDPDSAVIHPEVSVDWHIWEDRIQWTVGDEGAAMVELEGIDLDLISPPSIPDAAPDAAPTSLANQPGPWHPMTVTIDFPTPQLRTANRNASYGYTYCLPGMD